MSEDNTFDQNAYRIAEAEFDNAYADHIKQSVSNYILAKQITDTWEEKYENKDITLIQ